MPSFPFPVDASVMFSYICGTEGSPGSWKIERFVFSMLMMNLSSPLAFLRFFTGVSISLPSANKLWSICCWFDLLSSSKIFEYWLGRLILLHFYMIISFKDMKHVQMQHSGFRSLKQHLQVSTTFPSCRLTILFLYLSPAAVFTVSGILVYSKRNSGRYPVVLYRSSMKIVLTDLRNKSLSRSISSKTSLAIWSTIQNSKGRSVSCRTDNIPVNNI